ncbi:TMEM165/GDT1 family protein [Oscillatoria sp. CS-180]|uniref:TMEM165/GDT1 family protein n=1 Tax=Oscillatoria sp. CS-180 TaxID=3021720 RepID=UPI00232B0990|nr:TMEM165/GDT1 family protein [Oscillatoria sp. CS-180]MDB9524965.1 TMEM165/GDT1 family protein [Oscillatoria sp. CS-180]
MDWQLLGLSFVAVFLSELGDKSQLAAIALGGSSKHPRAVFLGTAGALLLASLIGALLGEGTSQLLPTRLVRSIAAIGFAVLAVRLLWPEKEVSFSQEDSNDS